MEAPPNNSKSRNWVAQRLSNRLPALAAILFVGLGIAAPVSEQDEPNDELVMATATGLADIGTVVLADRVLGDGDWADLDVDLYSIEITPGASLPILMTATIDSPPNDLDAYLRLFDGSGTEIDSNDDRGFDDLSPEIRTYLLESGTYFVGVSTTSNPRYITSTGGSGRPGSGGTYTLTVTTEGAAASTSTLEPNDRAETASVMGSESFTVSGELIGDGQHGRLDVDIYALDLTGAARVDVAVNASGVNALLDPVLRVRNCMDPTIEPTFGDPCSVGSADDAIDGSSDPAVSFGATEAQTFYIMVSGATNQRYDPAVAGSGEPGSVGYYDLYVEVSYVNVAAPDEPNDSAQTATRLSPFSTDRPAVIEIEGFLGDGRFAPFQGDRDFYEVTVLDESKWISIDVAPTDGSGLDPVVIAYDSLGNRLAGDDNSGPLRASSLVLPFGCVPAVEGARSMYIAVLGTAQRPPGDPAVPLDGTTVVLPEFLGDGPGSTGGYRMTVATTSVAGYCTNEGDDTLQTATPTGLVDEGNYACVDGEIGDGSCIDPFADTDIWSVEVGLVPALLYIDVSACKLDGLSCHGLAVFDIFGREIHIHEPAFQTPNVRTHAVIERPGTYFVAVTGDTSPSFDPTQLCQASGTCTGTYDLIITLAPMHSDSPAHPQRRGAPVAGLESMLFATRLDASANLIDTIDPSNGVIMNSFPAPEPKFGGAEALAFDGTHLYYVGTGHYPNLYRLDPFSGEVLDQFILWMGSGHYGDATFLNDELFVSDLLYQSIHVIDPNQRVLLRTLPVGAMNDVAISGGLAALSWPERLYVGGAFHEESYWGTTPKAVYEIDANSGVIVNTLFRPPSNCCRVRPDEACCDDPVLCGLTCEGYWMCCTYGWDESCVQYVFNVFTDVCFPENVLTNQPTTLSCSGGVDLHVADWRSLGTDIVDRDGLASEGLAFPTAVGSLAGMSCAGLFADFDRDGDVDLKDFAAAQRCFTGNATGADATCDVVDADQNKKIDLSDLIKFVDWLSGPS